MGGALNPACQALHSIFSLFQVLTGVLALTKPIGLSCCSHVAGSLSYLVVDSGGQLEH